MRLFPQAQTGLQQRAESVEQFVYNSVAQFVEIILAEAEQQAALRQAAEGGVIQRQSKRRRGVLLGTGNGAREIGKEVGKVKGFRMGAEIVVIGKFLQFFRAPR